ncbi:MAG: amidohydrolase family protein, partial [Gammaproteobacteria bacterium]
RIATLNGARALGLEREFGSIATGKQADLVAIDFSDPRLNPVYDPLSQIVYAAHRDNVSDVWVAGRHLVQSGVVAGVDPHELRADASRWQRLIRAVRPSG